MRKTMVQRAIRFAMGARESRCTFPQLVLRNFFEKKSCFEKNMSKRMVQRTIRPAKGAPKSCRTAPQLAKIISYALSSAELDFLLTGTDWG